MFYAIAHHGTTGLDSYGYAEVVELDERPRSDMTTTVGGPYKTAEEAQADADQMQKQLDDFRKSQEQ